MTSKLYKVHRPNHDSNFVVVFPTGDYFFSIPIPSACLFDILKGTYQNTKNNYVPYVREDGYRLKYMGSTTVFITSHPEFFI